MKRSRIAPLVALAALVAAACQAAPDGIDLRGAIYVDFRVDLPCAEQPAPAELSGVGLTFHAPDGSVLGSATTGGPQVEELPTGPGTETWAHGGCRFSAPYQVSLPVAASYAVEFTIPDPQPNPGGGFFTGLQELRPQTARHEDLVSSDFVWSFEVPPSFVVP